MMGMRRTRRILSLPVHVSPPSAPGVEPSRAEMVEWIGRQCPTPGTEALRAAFSDSPLISRIAALNLLIRRQSSEAAYMPR